MRSSSKTYIGTVKVLLVISVAAYINVALGAVNNDLESYSDLVSRVEPKYCQSDFNKQLTDQDCQDIIYFLKGKNIEDLDMVKDYVSKDLFLKELRRTGLQKLDLQRSQINKLFPQLLLVNKRKGHKGKILPENIKRRKKHIQQCLKEDKSLTPLPDTSRISPPKDIDPALESSFLAKQLLSQLKVESIWKKKKSIDARLKKSLNDVKTEQAKLSEMHKRFGNNRGFTVQPIQDRLISAKDSVVKLKVQKVHYDEIAFSNPLLIEYSDFFSKSEVRKSPFFDRGLKLFSQLNLGKRTNGSKQVSGKEVIARILEDLSKKSDNDSLRDFEITSKLGVLLDKNIKFKQAYSRLAQTQLKKQYHDIENTMDELCNSSETELHHFQPLVEETLLRRLVAGYKNKQNLNKIKDEFLSQHCTMLKSQPFEENNTIAYGAVGATMLAAGLFTPVGWGVALVAGGVAASGIGAVETVDAYERLKIAKGLGQVGLADFNQAKSSYDNYILLRGMTVADLFFVPIDVAQIGAKIGTKTLKGVAKASSRRMISRNHVKTVIEYPQEILHFKLAQDQEVAGKIFKLLEKKYPLSTRAQIRKQFKDATRKCIK